MKYLISFLSLTLLILFSGSCKKDPAFGDCFQEANKTKLKLTLLEGPTVTLPSKISIFFKVQDRNNNPVGYLTQDNFVIYEKGLNDPCHRVISEFEAKRRISGREQVFNHTTLLVLDLSGSVLQNSLTQLQEAALAFINDIIPATPDNTIAMGIWWFDGEDILHELEPVTSDIWELKAAVNSITPNISVDNSTDLYGAVIKSAAIAQQMLANYKAQGIAFSASVVLFTDGEDRANRYLKQDAYNAVAATPNDITWFTLGVGNEINVVDLQNFGRSGFFQINSADQLTTTFKQIASIVNSEANSYYLFEYCSPIRNGTNNGLIIEAFDLDSQEAGYLETTFDATGFTGGCQL
ncbi:MAG: VWA domain-containing protein [Saprospiraceae bacterium]|nr:MAG: VWA domain-containing protein [Saprospiraceae bacterium]